MKIERFEVLTIVTMNSSVLWSVASHSSAEVHGRFGEHYLYFQD
jgi:hypothetical protein